MAKYLPLPDGTDLEVPDAMSYADAMAAARSKFPNVFPDIKAAKDKYDDERDFSSSTARTFMHSLQESGPTAAAGLEALSRTAGLDTAADWLKEQRGKPEPMAVEPVKFGNALDSWKQFKQYTGEALGSGFGSTLMPIASGAAGAGIGALVGGAPTAVVGGYLGVGSTALPLNIGDLYTSLIDEGVPEGEAAPMASQWGAVISIPDVVALGWLGKKFLKKPIEEGTKALAKRLAKEAGFSGAAKRFGKGVGQGALYEGVTEGPVQEGIQQAVLAEATGTPLFTPERMERVATAGVAGLMVGAPFGGLGGATQRGREMTELQQRENAYRRKELMRREDARMRRAGLKMGPGREQLETAQAADEQAARAKIEGGPLFGQKAAGPLAEVDRTYEFETRGGEKQTSTIPVQEQEVDQQEVQDLYRQEALLISAAERLRQQVHDTPKEDTAKKGQLAQQFKHIEAASKVAAKRRATLTKKLAKKGIAISAPEQQLKDLQEERAKQQKKMDVADDRNYSDMDQVAEIAPKLTDLDARIAKVKELVPETSAQPDLFVEEARQRQEALKQQFEGMQAQQVPLQQWDERLTQQGPRGGIAALQAEGEQSDTKLKLRKRVAASLKTGILDARTIDALNLRLDKNTNLYSKEGAAAALPVLRQQAEQADPLTAPYVKQLENLARATLQRAEEQRAGEARVGEFVANAEKAISGTPSSKTPPVGWRNAAGLVAPEESRKKSEAEATKKGNTANRALTLLLGRLDTYATEAFGTTTVNPLERRALRTRALKAARRLKQIYIKNALAAAEVRRRMGRTSKEYKAGKVASPLEIGGHAVPSKEEIAHYANRLDALIEKLIADVQEATGGEKISVAERLRQQVGTEYLDTIFGTALASAVGKTAPATSSTGAVTPVTKPKIRLQGIPEEGGALSKQGVRSRLSDVLGAFITPERQLEKGPFTLSKLDPRQQLAKESQESVELSVRHPAPGVAPLEVARDNARAAREFAEGILASTEVVTETVRHTKAFKKQKRKQKGTLQRTRDYLKKLLQNPDATPQALKAATNAVDNARKTYIDTLKRSKNTPRAQAIEEIESRERAEKAADAKAKAAAKDTSNTRQRDTLREEIATTTTNRDVPEKAQGVLDKVSRMLEADRGSPALMEATRHQLQRIQYGQRFEADEINEHLEQERKEDLQGRYAQGDLLAEPAPRTQDTPIPPVARLLGFGSVEPGTTATIAASPEALRAQGKYFRNLQEKLPQPPEVRALLGRMKSLLQRRREFIRHAKAAVAAALQNKRITKKVHDTTNDAISDYAESVGEIAQNPEELEGMLDSYTAYIAQMRDAAQTRIQVASHNAALEIEQAHGPELNDRSFAEILYEIERKLRIEENAFEEMREKIKNKGTGIPVSALETEHAAAIEKARAKMQARADAAKAEFDAAVAADPLVDVKARTTGQVTTHENVAGVWVPGEGYTSPEMELLSVDKARAALKIALGLKGTVRAEGLKTAIDAALAPEQPDTTTKRRIEALAANLKIAERRVRVSKHIKVLKQRMDAKPKGSPEWIRLNRARSRLINARDDLGNFQVRRGRGKDVESKLGIPGVTEPSSPRGEGTPVFVEVAKGREAAPSPQIITSRTTVNTPKAPVGNLEVLAESSIPEQRLLNAYRKRTKKYNEDVAENKARSAKPGRSKTRLRYDAKRLLELGRDYAAAIRVLETRGKKFGFDLLDAVDAHNESATIAAQAEAMETTARRAGSRQDTKGRAGKPVFEAGLKGGVKSKQAEVTQPWQSGVTAAQALARDTARLNQQREMALKNANKKMKKQGINPLDQVARKSLYEQELASLRNEDVSSRETETIQAVAAQDLIVKGAGRPSVNDSGLAKQEADALHAKVIAKLPEGVRDKVTYVYDSAEVPQRFVDDMAVNGVQTTKGWILPSGEILVVGDQHKTIADMAETYFHETRHYGTDTFLGAQGMQALSDSIWSNDIAGIRLIADGLGLSSAIDGILKGDAALQSAPVKAAVNESRRSFLKRASALVSSGFNPIPIPKALTDMFSKGAAGAVSTSDAIRYALFRALKDSDIGVWATPEAATELEMHNPFTALLDRLGIKDTPSFDLSQVDALDARVDGLIGGESLAYKFTHDIKNKVVQTKLDDETDGAESQGLDRDTVSWMTEGHSGELAQKILTDAGFAEELKFIDGLIHQKNQGESLMDLWSVVDAAAALVNPQAYQNGMRRLVSTAAKQQVRRVQAELTEEQESTSHEEQREETAPTTKGTQKISKDARLAITRELLAHVGQPQTLTQHVQNFIKKVVNAIRAAFRRNGLDAFASASTQQIYDILRKSEAMMRSGKMNDYRGVGVGAGRVAAAPAYGQAANLLFGAPRTALTKVQGLLHGMDDPIGGFFDRYAHILPALKRVGKDEKAKKLTDNQITATMMGIRQMQDNHNMVSATMQEGPPEVVEDKELSKPGDRHFYIGHKEGGKRTPFTDVIKAINVVGMPGDENERVFTLFNSLLRSKTTPNGLKDLNLKYGEDAKWTADLDASLKDFEKWLGDNPEQHAALKEANRVYNRFNGELLEFMSQTGALPKRIMEALRKDGNYIPWYRKRDDGGVDLWAGTHSPVRIGDVKSQPFIQALRGGDQSVELFYDTAVQNISMILDAGVRNQAVKQLAFALDKAGLLSGGIRRKRTKTPNGIDFMVEPTDEQYERWEKSGESSRDWQLGQHHFTLDSKEIGGHETELILRGLEGIVTQLPTIVRAMGIPGRILRQTVMRSPLYPVRQFTNDIPQFLLTSGANLDIPLLLKVTNEILNPFSSKTSAGEAELLKTGLLGGNLYVGTEEDKKRISRQLAGQSGALGWLGNNWHSAMAALDLIAQKVDAHSRVYVYSSLRKQGLSKIEAVMRTREALDFTRRGYSPSMHFLTAMTPFQNTQLQSLRALGTAAMGTGMLNERVNVTRKFYTWGILAALASATYAASMQDDEDYKNATVDERMRYVFIPRKWSKQLGFDSPIRIRKPFETGTIFMGMAESTYNYMTEDRPHGYGDVLIAAAGNLVPPLLPTSVKLGMEHMLGIDTFTGRSIESQRDQAVQFTERANERTTEIAKAFSNTIGQGVDAATFGRVQISPKKFDHFIKGLFTNLGTGVMALANPMLRDTHGAGPIKTRIHENQIVGSMFQNPLQTGYWVSMAMQELEKIKQARGTYKKLVEDHRTADAERLKQKMGRDILLGGPGTAVGAYKKRMDSLVQMQRAVISAPEARYAPTKKRELLDKIAKQKNEASRMFIASARAGT